MADTSLSPDPSAQPRPPFGFMGTNWSNPILPTSGQPAPASGAVPDASPPDDDLIRCCADHAKCMAAVREAPDEEEDGPAWRAYEKNRDAISAARPQTLIGMIAKARAAKLEAGFWDTTENIHGTMAEPWAWGLVNSLLRLAGEG
jgi:hypothetical protein